MLQVAGVRKTRDPVERAKRYLLELELSTAAELKVNSYRSHLLLPTAAETCPCL